MSGAAGVDMGEVGGGQVGVWDVFVGGGWWCWVCADVACYCVEGVRACG